VRTLRVLDGGIDKAVQLKGSRQDVYGVGQTENGRLKEARPAGRPQWCAVVALKQHAGHSAAPT